MASESESGARWLTAAGLIPPAIALALFYGFCQAIPAVRDGGVLRYSWEWAPSLNVSLSFLIDGLSLTFALLISGIGVLVMLYSARYLAGHKQQARFSLYLTSFMLAMLGLVLADNLIGLFVFWELTTVTSYLLIGFSHAGADSRRSAMQALLVTAGGGLAMLVGFLIIGSITGSYELSEIRAMGDVLRDHGLYGVILILILAGAFTKSAQVPFHFWLPNAMAAPTPVSAYLHSATMVKGGVYLMARMHPSLSGTDAWLWSLTVFGAVTAVFASVVSIRQTDIKQTLAYTTLMALGTLTLFLAAPGGYAITAAATFLVVHSFYKASLFLMIGCVDYRAGTRETGLLGGLWRKMPLTALAAGLAAFSMAGIPPFLGFIAKELLYKGGLESTASVVLVVGATFAASALMFAVAGIVAFKPFWLSADDVPERHVPEAEAPWPMLVGPLLLAGLGIYFGLQSHWLRDTLITPTVAALLGDPAKAKELHLWTGVNTALILSVLTFAAGFILYFTHQKLRAALIRAEESAFSFDDAWDRILDGLERFSVRLTDALQTGELKRYLAVVFLTLLVGLVFAILRSGISLDGVTLPSPGSYGQYAVFVLTLAGTVLTVATRSRIAAICGMGVVGIGVALIFIVYGAPDVAITQLMVEVLVVVLFAVAALRLPMLPRRSGHAPRYGDAVIAISLGALVSVILMAVTIGPIDRRLTDYFEAASWPEAFGRNIVNVILVDFRALDTFGEIAVVAVAALSALALLRQNSKGGSS